MKALAIYGASDDLIEVEGEVAGADEFDGERATFVVAGLRITVEYHGCWAIQVIQVDEDVPVTAQDMALTVNERMDGGPGYSMRLDMLVPDDVVVVREADYGSE